jgi:hypothetical protein
MEEDILSDVVPSNIVSRQVSRIIMRRELKTHEWCSPVKAPTERASTTRRTS